MKLTAAELGNKLDLARSRFPRHSVWQHYKGGVYEVIDHTILTDDELHTLVVYRRIGGPAFYSVDERGITYARPIAEWTEIVEKDDLYLARFRRIA
jgi:hypothetical protein